METGVIKKKATDLRILPKIHQNVADIYIQQLCLLYKHLGSVNLVPKTKTKITT